VAVALVVSAGVLATLTQLLREASRRSTMYASTGAPPSLADLSHASDTDSPLDSVTRRFLGADGLSASTQQQTSNVSEVIDTWPTPDSLHYLPFAQNPRLGNNRKRVYTKTVLIFFSLFSFFYIIYSNI